MIIKVKTAFMVQINMFFFSVKDMRILLLKFSISRWIPSSAGRP